MEAPSPTHRTRWRSRWRVWIRNRWIRLPFLFAGGLGAAAIGSVILTPRWLSLCRGWVERPARCSPMSHATMAGYLVIGLGVFMLILGPVVAALLHLRIHGQKWETSRFETAVSNIPIVVGFAYLVIGFVIAANG